MAYVDGGRKIPGSVELNVGGKLPGDGLCADPLRIVTKLDVGALIGSPGSDIIQVEGPQHEARNQDCQQCDRNQETAIQADPGRGHVSGS